jgi:SAM-dependent methyltransferase
MSARFDAYRTDYEAVVQRSIAFSGLQQEFFIAAKVALLADLFAERLGGRRPQLLDVGCGVGRMHAALRPIAGSLAGCDVSREALDRARLEHAWAEYRAYDGTRLPWDDAAFEVSLAVCVLHHVEPAGRPALVAEMRRVTRPGGLVALIEHNRWNPATRLAVARCPFDDDAVLLGARRSRALLSACGLNAVESRHFLLLPTAAQWARRLERRLWRLPAGAQYLAFGTV